MKKLCMTLWGSSVAMMATFTHSADAITWSDNALSYRFGTQFHEPSNDRNVTKNIVSFTHVSGYSHGQNFFNVDMLQSNKADPSKGSGNNGATEFYATYRHQLYLSKVFDTRLAFGPVKDVALTAGFDLNTKNTAFAPRKRLVVVGPTLKFDVPRGFVDLSLLWGKEWNHCGLGAPACPHSNLAFDPQLIASLAWSLPFNMGAVPLKFQGFVNYNSPKGKDYAGVSTKAEVLMRTSLMMDVGNVLFEKKNTFWLGVGYEYWHNKFGNRYMANGKLKPGIKTTAPTLQAEWHF